MKKKKKGFTLIEILVVVAILAIIVAIALPVYNRISKNTKQKAYENKVAQIEVAAESYANETNKPRMSVDELVKKGFYSADNDSDEVLSPIDKSVMNCYILDVTRENDQYYAEMTETNSCEEAKDLADRPGVIITATTEDDKTIPKNDKGVYDWTNQNVKLKATLTDNANIAIESFEWFANNSKIADATQDTYLVKAELIINTPYQVRIKLTKQTDEGPKSITVSGSIMVKIDKQKPVTTRIEVENADIWRNANKSVNINGTDFNGSGIAGYFISGEKTCTTTMNYKSDYKDLSNITNSYDNGTYYICIKDKAGNVSAPTEFTVIKVDKVAPVINSVATSTTWALTNSMSFTATDNGEIVAYSFIPKTSNVSWNNVSPTKTLTISKNDITQNGTYRLHVKDAAGNFTTKEISIDFVDRVAPVLSSGSITSSGMNATFTDVGSGVKEIKYYYGTSSNAPSTSSFTTSKNVSFSCGTYYYGFAYATDKVGNTSTIYSLGSTYSYACPSYPSGGGDDDDDYDYRPSRPSGGGGGGGSSCDWKCEMQANSEAWHSASASEKKELEQKNKDIASKHKDEVGGFSSGSGKWSDKNGNDLLDYSYKGKK